MKHVLSDFDLTEKEVYEVLNLSTKIKQEPENYYHTLTGKTLLMLFELASLRTRISFEAGMTQLGGHAIFYDVSEKGFSRSETLSDGIKVLSRYGDCLMVRILKQKAIEEIGAAATVPVINGMTEEYHPCQNLTDIFTIQENKGELEDLKIAYVGDGGCNTAASTMIGCASLGMNVTIVCPEYPAYTPSSSLINKVNDRSKGTVLIDHNIKTGVDDADVVYTDVWVSAGMEKEKENRIKAFLPYQVNSELLSYAKKDSIVMHCLPAHRGYEITSQVMDSNQSVVIDQAENRMHAQKGLLTWLLC
jgi:ornithine carbamoyltransferase